jgi:hypothetical protein
MPFTDSRQYSSLLAFFYLVSRQKALQRRRHHPAKQLFRCMFKEASKPSTIADIRLEETALIRYVFL